jgi:hypothetical protein
LDIEFAGALDVEATFTPSCLLQLQRLSKALSAMAGFAGVSVPNLRRKKNAYATSMTATIAYYQTPTQPQPIFQRKRERLCSTLSSYGFFLSTSVIIAMQTMIATKSPAMAGMKYRSAADGGCVGCGVAAIASWAWNAVDACEL